MCANTQKVQQEGIQSEQVVKAMMAQLLGAIAFVHSKGIVHRDIKPDNIILRGYDGNPVLIDFGAVKETMNTVMNSQKCGTHSIVVGTPGYMPVEQLSGRPVYSSDIYSLGMTAIYMLTGKVPQEVASDPASDQFFWREHAPSVSPNFANFLDTATHTSSQSRFPTIQRMQSALNLLETKTVPNQVSPSFEHHAQRQTPTIDSMPSAPSVVNTAVASPVYKQKNSQHLAQASRKPDSSSKSALIIGSMVGLSVLIGSVILVKSWPKTAELTEAPTSAELPLSAGSAPLPMPSPAPASVPTPDSVSAPASASSLPIEPSSVVKTKIPTPSLAWEFMGTSSSGESVSVNASSIRQSDGSIDFEYKIGDELIVASADCRENRWYAEKYGWYSPQSEATQSLLNLVCQ